LDHLPGNIRQLEGISGFGVARVARFGEQICDFINEEVIAAEEQKIYKTKGVTYRKTWQLIKSGKDVQEIAKDRKLSQNTIYTHIAHLYKEGYAVDVNQYIRAEDKNKILALWEELGRPDEYSVIRETLPDFGFGLIQLALAEELSEMLNRT
jgi:ATP-dependent DNA helicase RecQ